MKPIIINSDDFGHDKHVNRAIIRAFGERLCSSTTLMANMPGFEEAVELAHERRLVDRVGIHVVLSEGTPLSDPIKRCSRFCTEDGEFRHRSRECYRNLTREERNAVKIEILRQIEKCRTHGLPLTHMDSHQHVHHSWGSLAAAFIEAGEERGIPYIRPRRFRIGVPWYRRITTLLYNAKLARRHLAGTDYFVDVGTFLQVQSTMPSWQSSHALEIMVHPTLGEDGSLLDAVDHRPLFDSISQVKAYQMAISYAHLS